MISSPSAQIVNAIAEKTFITNFTGDRVEAYGPVMGVATAIIAVGIIVTAAPGPEMPLPPKMSMPMGKHSMPMPPSPNGSPADIKGSLDKPDPLNNIVIGRKMHL